jgi:hypothetical protein
MSIKTPQHSKNGVQEHLKVSLVNETHFLKHFTVLLVESWKDDSTVLQYTVAVHVCIV